MLTDAYPTDVRARKFVAELLNQFEPSTSLITVRKCLDLISDIFRPRRTLSNHILNLSERSKDTHNNVAQNLLNALSDLLHDKRLRAQMSTSFDSGDIDTANAQRTACVGLIQEAIRLNQVLKAKPELVKAGGKLLSSIVGLLPTPELVQCAETLLAQKDEEVRLVAVGSVLNRAKEISSPKSDDVRALLDFMKPLVEVLKASDSVALSAQAVTCLGQIIKSFGKKDTGAVVAAVQVVAGDKALKHMDGQVQLASVVCLTVAVRILKDEFIPLVPSVLPVVFSYLENILAADEQGKALSLTISCFAFVQALVEQLPFLVTGESLDKVLLFLAQAGDVSKLKESRGHLWRLVAKNVEAGEALPAFERNYQAISEVGSLQVSISSTMQRSINANRAQGLVEMFSSLRLAITSRPKSEIIRNASTLFELFLKAFDQQRIIQTSDQEEVDYDDEELERLELIYQEVALMMVMKLSDSTFRPFIVRLSEWATQLPTRDVKGRMLRATSMFNFLASLFAKLKGLVTSYATYALDLATDLLTNTEPGEDDAEELLEAVLIALTQSFEQDDEGFWASPHHFTPISTPLLTLLQKSALSQTADDTDLTDKVQEAIRTLVSTTSAQDQHRTINTALLKMMRHEDGKVRLAAVKTERELCEKMGDEWLGMLPEMLPFVAELMEDDEKEVERAGREWVRFLEGVLGENLDLS
jgi:U3 small nucleolar RNA-associated protein 10